MLGSIYFIYVPFGLSPPRPQPSGTNGTGHIGTGTARCSATGAVVHAPTRLDMRVQGRYQSILPDGQVAYVDWDDGYQTIDWVDGSFAGYCDTILSANLLNITWNPSVPSKVDWDLHDLSEDDNDIGHGLAEDNLGLGQCSARVYNLLIKNWDDSEGDMLIGGAASDEWTGFFNTGATLTLPPDSVFALIAESPSGMPVIESNALLKIEAVGGDIQYGLNFNGCSN